VFDFRDLLKFYDSREMTIKEIERICDHTNKKKMQYLEKLAKKIVTQVNSIAKLL